jgi:hypothetical protein
MRATYERKSEPQKMLMFKPSHFRAVAFPSTVTKAALLLGLRLSARGRAARLVAIQGKLSGAKLVRNQDDRL